jgi:hypothetical protein
VKIGLVRVFYASGHWHEPGDQVQPGSWGRVVQGAGSTHPWFGYEMLFELIRQTEFPEAPSRLQCLMASESAETARLWLQPPRSHVYELDTQMEPVSVDVGWINRLVLNQAVHDLATAQRCIRGYWTGESCPDGAPRELLVDQPATVIARL